MSLANDYKGISDRVTVIAATTGNKTDKIRVAAYCRVSTDKTDQVNSFITQMRYYTDYIKSNPKMILIDIYADEGISGTLMDKRDEFKRLLKDCKNRKIDRVLVKSVTRFARNSLECIEAVRELKSYGVSVFFENDKIDTIGSILYGIGILLFITHILASITVGFIFRFWKYNVKSQVNRNNSYKNSKDNIKVSGI